MFEAALAELGAWSPSGCSRDGLRSSGAALGRVRAAVDAAEVRLAAEMAAHVADPATEIRGATRCSRRAAERLASRADTTAAVPDLAHKFAAGGTSGEHVDVLTRAVAQTSAEAVRRSGLVDLATKVPPEQLTRAAREFVRDQQTDVVKEATRRRRRSNRRADWFGGGDGMWILHAEFDPDAVVDADGAHDAETGLAVARSEAARLACVSDLFGLVLGGEGEPLWHGRRKRRATDAQLRALNVRDGGCVICSARPSLCEAHHVVHWDGPGKGRTDIDNLALLCRHHHHMLHDHGLGLCRCADGHWQLRARP